MLYEVITSQVADIERELMRSSIRDSIMSRFVITSYSIHYTKLYESRTSGNHSDSRVSALYMDSPSLANRFLDQITDAFVYTAFHWRRYLPAQYVFALRCL